MERLQKYMARHGIASRRKCEELIGTGAVKVNGKVITAPGTTVNPERDKVSVNGKLLRQPPEMIYIMLNKPRGYISSINDPRGRKTIMDLLKNVEERVYPVGRLDYDSEGLLLLTNDGELTMALTHPARKVNKTYRVRVKGMPPSASLVKMSSGLMLEDGPTAPAEVEYVDSLNGNALLEISIHEGRNRQVRRMCEVIGHPALRLKRVSIGELKLGDLKPGQFRHLTRQEITRLKKIQPR